MVTRVAMDVPTCRKNFGLTRHVRNLDKVEHHNSSLDNLIKLFADISGVK